MTTPKQHTRPAGLDGCRMPAERLIARLIERRFGKAERPVLIAVGGPGGTGKSMFSRALRDLLPEAQLFRMDEYKTPRAERKEKRLSGPHPDANNMALLERHLRAMKSGETFDMPRYDQVTGAASSTAPYTPGHYNLLDGEVSTYAVFEGLVDLALYIDADWTTQLLTRVTRDIAERGHSREKVLETFLRSNLCEYPEHGAPTKHGSDVHLFRHENQRVAVETVASELAGDVEEVLSEDTAGVSLDGLVVAMTTPFDDAGEVDMEAFKRHIDFLAGHGCGRLLIGGTMGEFFSLRPEERRQLFLTARKHSPSTLVCHVSGDCLATTRDNVRWAQDHGTDALLVLPPVYPSGLSEAGVTEYLAGVAEVCTKPLVFYEFPVHTNNPIPAAALETVPHYGVKDSGGSGAFIGHTPHYFTARDDKIAEYHHRGACGFYAGGANFAPAPYVALEAALRDGSGAAHWQAEVDALAPGGAEGIPSIKARTAAALPGYPANVRTPLVKA